MLQENLVHILTLIKRKRSIIQPNDGFVEQLKKLQKEIKVANKLVEGSKKNIGHNYELKPRQDEGHSINLLSLNKNISNHTKI